MMALFDGARIKIKVGYVLIRCGVPKEYRLVWATLKSIASSAILDL
jgi:hypothetical protein